MELSVLTSSAGLTPSTELLATRTGTASESSYFEGFHFLLENAQVVPEAAPEVTSASREAVPLSSFSTSLLDIVVSPSTKDHEEAEPAETSGSASQISTVEAVALVPQPQPPPLLHPLQLLPQLGLLSTEPETSAPATRNRSGVQVGATEMQPSKAEVVDDQVLSFSAKISEIAAENIKSPRSETTKLQTALPVANGDLKSPEPSSAKGEASPVSKLTDLHTMAALKARALDANTDQQRDPSNTDDTGSGELPTASAIRSETNLRHSSFSENVKEAQAVAGAREVMPSATDPVKSLDIRIGDDGAQIRLRLVEQGGEVKAIVTSSSAHLAEQIRSELPELSRSLSDGGFHSEIRTPEVARLSSASDMQQSSEQNDSNRQGQFDGSAGQHPGRQDEGRKADSEDQDSNTFQKEMMNVNG